MSEIFVFKTNLGTKNQTIANTTFPLTLYAIVLHILLKSQI